MPDSLMLSIISVHSLIHVRFLKGKNIFSLVVFHYFFGKKCSQTSYLPMTGVRSMSNRNSAFFNLHDVYAVIFDKKHGEKSEFV